MHLFKSHWGIIYIYIYSKTSRIFWQVKTNLEPTMPSSLSILIAMRSCTDHFLRVCPWVSERYTLVYNLYIKWVKQCHKPLPKGEVSGFAYGSFQLIFQPQAQPSFVHVAGVTQILDSRRWDLNFPRIAVNS